MMRVMVVARLFSGLADSLSDGTWQPKGVPAIYHLLEGLAARPDIELLTVFTCKDAFDGKFKQARQFAVDPIGDVVILPWAPRPLLARFGLDGKLRELSHLIRCLNLYRKFRPDTTYWTNANFLIAGLFAQLGLSRTMLRFLGIHPEQKRLAVGGSCLQRWFYRSPFDLAICSLDGSGGRAYLPKLLSAETPIEVILNGVDAPQPCPEMVADLREKYGLGGRPVVAFVGRLEANKGCREFVLAAGKVLERRPDSIDAVVVGGGAMFNELQGIARTSKLRDRIHMIGQVSHAEVPAWLEIASVYVSINHYGSLSNANLEAVSAGKCVVILEKDPATHTDEETEDVLPTDSVVRIDRHDIENALADTLIDLVDSPDKIAQYAEGARQVAARTFRTWEERIDYEIDLIRA
jgi:glycosyltransferase involved in cell wall biosynthesis